MSLREFYGGFATGILMDGVMGCRYGGFMQVFSGFYTGFLMYGIVWGLRVGFRSRLTCPPSL